MASIIPFLDESETLFSQEDVIRARTTIMENLNDLLTAGSPQAKIELIVKIQEQVLKWAPAMRVLEEVIDDVLALALDQSQDVKRAIVGFIEEVCKLRIRMLPKVIKCMMLLLREDAAAVTKRVIQACGSIYKNTLQWMCSSEDVTEEMKDCWDQLCLIKAQILDMIDHENDGIRTNAIKFLEGVVLLQTHPDPDSLKVENDFSLDDVPLTLTHIRRRKLEEEAMNIFEILLKFHGASHISSVNLIACTGTLCIIAKRRPSLMSQVVEALKNLHSNLPPTLTNSQVSSVRKNLKMQFINLLKLPSSFEWRSIITPILSDLGATQNEINRAMPKMDKKEVQMRTKRALENEEARSQAKKARLEIEEKKKSIPKVDYEMEVDYDEVREQQNKSNVINEKFIADAIKNVDVAAYLVVTNMQRLPDRCPQDFIKNYPSGSVTLTQQIDRIAKGFAEQLTENKLGPGSNEITEKPPMRAKMSAEEERNIIMSGFKPKDDEENFPKDETTRKLRETLERMKDQPKLKQRVKTLKLHEITKPLHKDLKHQFLLDAVKRVLKCERYANIGGMGFKRKKIITVFASTFMPSVKAIIMDYIMEDVIKRFDLAFMWLFEEYSMMQGFTRHSYVKSEHKHDYAYNLLLTDFCGKILSRGSEFRERESLIKRLFLEAPLISDDSVKILESMAENEELYDCGLVLLKDLIIRRPPKEEQLLGTLLKFTAHQNQVVRDKAVEYVMSIYSLHKILLDKIETFSINLLKLLEKATPTKEAIKIFTNTSDELPIPDAWSEDMIKGCLQLYLTLIPFNESLLNSLCDVYNAACPEVKRVILRSIESSVKNLGPDSKGLLNIVESCAKGTETLVTRIIYILTESHTPSADLVEKVRNLYNTKLNDVRILIPIVLYLSKKEIVASLPKFLKLNPQLIKDVFTRLLTGSPQPITPTELLVALHAIDTSQAELKLIVKATSMCLTETEVYTHEVLGSVMQQLVEMSPLPTLLMRTVIQSHTLYPRLSGFIINLLHRLIVKQVWRSKLIWDGFVKCCQRLQPASMGVLIQLPTPQLQDALNICPDLKAPLLEHAQEMNRHQSSHMTQQVLDLLLGNSSSSENKSEPMDQTEPDAPGM